MTKFAAIGVLIIVVILGIGFIFLNKSSSPVPSVNKNNQQASGEFGNPKKSAHYESNTPEHGSTLAGVPINVVINFNFDLAKPSEITIEKDPSTGSGQAEYGVGETIIDEDKLSMRRNMAPNAPDGIYTVNYNACWPDGSCHDGYFQFAIDRSLSSQYEDMTGQKEITIRMSDIAFVPMNIKVSKGTKITWINDEDIEHFVNTESHPAHTYYPEQNSRGLQKGDTYSVTFTGSGIYPYHCSAHADTMQGSIIVE